MSGGKNLITQAQAFAFFFNYSLKDKVCWFMKISTDLYLFLFFLCLQVCFLVHFLYKSVCPPENVGVGTAVRRLLERSSSTKLVRPVIGLSLLIYLFQFLFFIFISSTYLSIFFYPAFILVNNV